MALINYPHSFDTIVEAVKWLMEMGFVYDFDLDSNCIRLENTCKIPPDEFEVDYVFRFEGCTDPGDENIVYGISSCNQKLKGVLINTCSVYAATLSNDMVRKLITSII